ncbi:Sua5/YciO/YrdC/YwlC family protein [Gallibacterium sp. ZY190522]
MKGMNNLDFIVSQLKQGKVIAYPTEAVFGLGCDPFNEQAIEKLLKLKQRPKEKGLILIAPYLDFFKQIIDFDRFSLRDLKRLQQTYTRPTTWIVPVQKQVSPLLTGRFETIAIRLCRHPSVENLCQLAEMPITSTSANLSGQEPCRTYLQVQEQFGENFPVLQAEVGDAKNPSEIRDLFTNQIVRQG